MDINYNDRPASVYENVSSLVSSNINTSTPKMMKQQNTNGSPYSDIAFKFDEINHDEKQLSNGSNSNKQSNNNREAPHFNNYVMTTATMASQLAATPAATPATEQQISQRLTLNDNSSTNQSIAAVKAALHDAKSKFFGLNGYAPSSSLQLPESKFEYSQSLLSNDEAIQSKVQIIPKAQPKYQNIPENSAIYQSVLRKETLSTQSATVVHLPEIVDICAYEPKSTPRESSSSPLTQHSQCLTMSLPPLSESASAPTPVTASQTITLGSGGGYQHILLSDLDSRTQQPSQAVYMTTTVPQNIKGSKIAGRHTPTRNSLRHSRMLVVNKNYQGMQYPNPLNFKYPNFARTLLILELIFGSIILFIGVWIFFLAPSTRIQDNPYWSGLALLFAGVIGLVLIRYHRIKRHKIRENCFIFLRADSYLLSMVAVLLCSIAFICAALHFAKLSASDTKCASSDILLAHASCLCTFNSGNATIANNATAVNSTDDVSNIFDQSYSFHYRDLSCIEVKGEWMHILASSFIFNLLGFLIAVIYLFLFTCFRQDSKRLYASVATSTF